MPGVRSSEKAESVALPLNDAGVLCDSPQHEQALAARWRQRIDAGCWFRRAVLTRLQRLQAGCMTVVDRSGRFEFGEEGAACVRGVIQVHHRRFYRAVILGGALSAAESYLRGDWDSPDLLAALRVLAQNSHVLTETEQGPTRLLRPLRSLANWWRRNTPAGSRRNIGAHYDLSNDFFALMLDRTMTYSSAIFPSRTATLEEGSLEKYDRICRKLSIKPDDNVVEIGTGWGGFAEYAARNYGCRVTTTTISNQQYQYALRRFQDAGLLDRITLLKDDYRDLGGTYDKLVSIEMIEAVGEQFLSMFFGKCSDLLEPKGTMLLQSITMPDNRYPAYRKSVDFIQRYIFPGGFLPSLGAMTECWAGTTNLRLVHLEEFAAHYAETLARWRSNFWHNMKKVQGLDLDNRFLRTWHYYLCYCEAAFRERQVGVAQLLLTKPGCRLTPLETAAPADW